MVLSWWRQTCIHFLSCSLPIKVSMCQIVLPILTMIMPWEYLQRFNPLKSFQQFLIKLDSLNMLHLLHQRIWHFCDRSCFLNISLIRLFLIGSMLWHFCQFSHFFCRWSGMAMPGLIRDPWRHAGLHMSGYALPPNHPWYQVNTPQRSRK